MRKTFIALAVALSAIGVANAAPTEVSTKVPAQASEHRFSQDGYTYVYKVTDTRQGKTFTGTRFPGGDEFTLTVAGDRVVGTNDGMPVEFSVSEALGN